MADRVGLGTMVRIELQGRRVGGWVIELDSEPPAGTALRPIAKVTGWGPLPDVLDLTEWAAWRWAGRRVSLLRSASPDRAVVQVPPPQRPGHPVPESGDELAEQAFARGATVVRLAPGADRYPLVLAACRRGNALVVLPGVDEARHLAMRLRRAGVPVALAPDDWAQARGGSTVVGARSAAWAPVVDLAAVLVLDEHDEAHKQEQTPAWHARDVVVERARRAGVPCVLASPTPSLEALALGPLLAPSRSVEREGWPVVDVVDRRREDLARAGLWSERLVDLLRSDRRVVCVLNRKGRARLLACATCGELARCERCQSAVTQPEPGVLACVRCGLTRPTVCASCGGTKLKLLRLGVSRAAEELIALARTEVVEVTGDGGVRPADARVYVGTEAVLHHVPQADVVAFLDLDQELLAPRYRAAEQALGLLARAARILGGRRRDGRLLLQTRLPQHEVVQAALHADPTRVSDVEAARRRELGFPPATAMAAISGAGAEEYVTGLAGVDLLGPRDGTWLARAPDHDALLGALAATPRPAGRLRVEVDPLRV
jgi:primosomal protein N' (replication factor Y) (superfamily II helicase)